MGATSVSSIGTMALRNIFKAARTEFVFWISSLWVKCAHALLFLTSVRNQTAIQAVVCRRRWGIRFRPWHDEASCRNWKTWLYKRRGTRARDIISLRSGKHNPPSRKTRSRSRLSTISQLAFLRSAYLRGTSLSSLFLLQKIKATVAWYTVR